MKHNYHELITKISIEIAESILSSESSAELVEEVAWLDGEVAQMLRKIGLQVMSHLLEALQRQLIGQEKGLGDTIHRSNEIVYSVIFGQLKLHSVYLYGAQGGQRPLRAQMGICHQGRSQTVEQALSAFGSEESFEQGAQRFEEHYGWLPDKSTVRRVTLRVAQEGEAYYRQRLEAAMALPPVAQQPPEELLVELDGCEIRTGVLVPLKQPVDDKTSAPSKPKKKRLTHWRDVRIGLVRPLDTVSKLYIGAMEDYPSVVRQLLAIAIQQGMTPKTQIVAVADGGQGLKEELEVQFHPLQFILDRPHLKSHLYETAEALGLSAEQRTAWVESRLQQIDQGRASAVIKQLRREEQQQTVDRRRQLVGYLERFEQCLHYDAFKAKGWPIGSGEVESAHRIIPQKRLKLPGAWWHPDHINPMLALRLLRANGWWKEFWQQQQLSKKAA